MTDIVEAIAHKFPGVSSAQSDGVLHKFQPDVPGVNYGTDGIPTQADQDKWIAEYDAFVAANLYKSKRAEEYPSIADQLDDIYHNGIDAWKATIKVTKDKYPK